MNKENGFTQALLKVISYPVYLVYAVITVIYAIAGNAGEAFLLILCLALSVLLKSYFLFCSDKSVRKGAVPEQKKKKHGFISAFVSVSDVFCIVCAFACVPLMIYGLTVSDGGGLTSVLSKVLSLMACGLSMFSGSRGSVLSYAASAMMSSVFPGRGDCGFTGAESMESIAGTDTLFILCPELLYDKQSCVRSLYYSGTHYRGMSLSESGLKAPAELGYYVFSCIKTEAENNPTLNTRDCDAVLSFASVQNADRQGFYNKIYANDVRTDFPQAGNISVFSKFGENHRGSTVYVCSVSASVLEYCVFMRTRDGRQVPLTEAEQNDILKAFDEIRRGGLSPYIIVSSTDVGDEDSSLRRATFETMFGIGGSFPENNSEICASLEEFGVRPVLVLPSEKKASLNFTVSGGMAGGADDCATLTDFISAPETIGTLVETRSAFHGFEGSNAVSLARRFRKNGKNILTVLRRSKDLALTGESGASCSVTGVSDEECIKVCDSAVPPAGGEGTGLEGIFNLITTAVSSACKLCILRNIMLSYTVLLLSVFVLSLFTGASDLLPSGSQILFASAFISFCSSYSVTGDRLILQSRDVLDLSAKRERARYVRYFGLGFISAVGICACGILAFKNDTGSLRAFIEPALLISGLSVSCSERLFSGASYGRSGVNFRALVCFPLTLLVTLALLFIPSPESLSFSSGNTGNPLRVLLYAVLPALVPPVYLWIAGLIRKVAEPESLF